jgi:hypothetical protein
MPAISMDLSDRSVGAIPGTAPWRRCWSVSSPSTRPPTRCGGTCVNLDEDDAHCGECNRACNGDLTCLNGECGCDSGMRCGNDCVELDESHAHCGQCDRTFQGDLTCSGGECVCAAGTRCGNQCVNTQTNPNHCGACDDPCGAGEECVDGQCEIPIATCTRDDDCRPFLSFKAPRCLSGRCQCIVTGEGLCTLANGTTVCDACCPGGNGACVRPEHVLPFASIVSHAPARRSAATADQARPPGAWLASPRFSARAVPCPRHSGSAAGLPRSVGAPDRGTMKHIARRVAPTRRAAVRGQRRGV